MGKAILISLKLNVNLFPDENTDVGITANQTPRRLLTQMPIGSPGNTGEKNVH